MFENVACKISVINNSQVIWYSVINSIIHQQWNGKCYCLLPKYLYLTCTWLKKYLMSSKYSEYLNLYVYLQIWKSTCTWLKYFEKYLAPTLIAGYQKNAPLCDCNKDLLWAQLRFHYDLCIIGRLIPRPHSTQDMGSVRPSVIRMRPYSDITLTQATALHCLGAPAASIAHTQRPYHDPTVTISVSLYIWLHSMAS